MNIIEGFYSSIKWKIFLLLILEIDITSSVRIGLISNTTFIGSLISETYFNISCTECTCAALSAFALGWNCMTNNNTCYFIQNYTSNDIGLVRTVNANFYFKQIPSELLTTINTVITTTSTTTTSTTSTVSTTTTSTTKTVSTTTTSTTTTTNSVCGSTCVNTTTSTSSRLAYYSFDLVVTDAVGNHSLSGIASPSYVNGWINSAVNFSSNKSQHFIGENILLNSTSFTIDFWFYATDLSSWDYSFMGEFSSSNTDQCLFLNIRDKKLYFGFFNDDTDGNTIITVNKWYHAAFVYDSTVKRQYIYLNGKLDSYGTAFSDFIGSSIPFTIGGARIGGSTSSDVYYSGIIDHLTISNRVKSACEIYLDANLACYFTFDLSSSLLDSGPNFLTATNSGGVTTIPGRIGRALTFSSSLSFLTVNGISALQFASTVFTISMWINPTYVSAGATLIHASTQSNGKGRCLLMWGLTSNGMISVNVIDGTNNTISATATSSLLLNRWTHIAQTFSTTNGNRLYIDGVLIVSVSGITGHPLGPYTIIGSSPTNTSYCPSGSIVPGQFLGSIDEYRVFGMELSSIDICRLANP